MIEEPTTRRLSYPIPPTWTAGQTAAVDAAIEATIAAMEAGWATSSVATSPTSPNPPTSAATSSKATPARRRRGNTVIPKPTAENQCHAVNIGRDGGGRRCGRHAVPGGRYCSIPSHQAQETTAGAVQADAEDAEPPAVRSRRCSRENCGGLMVVRRYPGGESEELCASCGRADPELVAA